MPPLIACFVTLNAAACNINSRRSSKQLEFSWIWLEVAFIILFLCVCVSLSLISSLVCHYRRSYVNQPVSQPGREDSNEGNPMINLAWLGLARLRNSTPSDAIRALNLNTKVYWRWRWWQPVMCSFSWSHSLFRSCNKTTPGPDYF